MIFLDPRCEVLQQFGTVGVFRHHQFLKLPGFSRGLFQPFGIHDRFDSIKAVVDTEGLELAPGETWELEELMVAEDSHRSKLLKDLATRIQKNHPKQLFQPVPTGWCSWYCFGPRVTAEQVLQNLDVISQKVPKLKYVQIDDGYQTAMGDWLETGKAFGGDVVAVLKEIRKRGFEPAIWVAPFVAEQSSHVFQQHPEWFIPR